MSLSLQTGAVDGREGSVQVSVRACMYETVCVCVRVYEAKMVYVCVFENVSQCVIVTDNPIVRQALRLSRSYLFLTPPC